MSDTPFCQCPVVPGPPRLVRGNTERERMPTVVVEQAADVAILLADRISATIARCVFEKGRCVLGLASGRTPIGIYRELVRRHVTGDLDFSRVATFNLDEYYPIDPANRRSYRYYMEENLFRHVNIDPSNAHMPDGSVHRDDVDGLCAAYEEMIRAAGGIDFQILGIGRTGHIGFNEPGSTPGSRTRLITLDAITRCDAASDFPDEVSVPAEAITMGIATILEAREIALIATGEHKADIVRRAIEEEPTAEVTASFLQGHAGTTAWLDRAAAGRLTRLRLADEGPG